MFSARLFPLLQEPCQTQPEQASRLGFGGPCAGAGRGEAALRRMLSRFSAPAHQMPVASPLICDNPKCPETL